MIGTIQRLKESYVLILIVEMLLGITITAIGLSCMMKSGLGQTSITSFTQNITLLTGMKSGTVLIIFFLSCTVLQILILKRQFEKIQLLQIVLALVQGKIVNLICYDLPYICDLYPQSYFAQWCLIFIGIFFCSYGVAMLFQAELVKNPFEELAMVLANKLHMEFNVFRTYIDILFMVVSILMIILFRLDFTTVREGTWASMLLLGKSMKYTFPMAEMTSLHHRKRYMTKLQ